ncbi:hypothetical protein [Pseudomonas flexibilis]|uniref:WYL domain-containing protein n=1 Tax=Pseudomonas flexibilis TaxID=706570 RepID=UPI001113B96B|nr:hypothetical protein [Pseudomonas flexibilis]
MKEFLAAASVIGSFASVWYANYWLMSVDGSGKLRRHGVSIGIAVLISSALVWMLFPGEGADGIGWGWVLLACLLSLAMAAYAAAVPGAIEETLAKQSASSVKPASPKAKTRAIRTGWSIGEVEFKYRDADGVVTLRRVTVHSVTPTYLKGECHERGAERTFRLDRIIDDLVDCQTGEVLSALQWVKRG